MSRLWYRPSQEAAAQPPLDQRIITEAGPVQGLVENVVRTINVDSIQEALNFGIAVYVSDVAIAAFALHMDLRNEINQMRNEIGQVRGTVQEIMYSQEAENDNHP